MNAPVLQYATEWIALKKMPPKSQFQSKNIKGLHMYRVHGDEKEECFKACARLRKKILWFGAQRHQYYNSCFPYNASDELRISEDQAKNATAIAQNEHPGTIDWKAVFPHVKEIQTSCTMWCTGRMKFTPSHLPALRHVIINGTEFVSECQPFPAGVSYITVIELRMDVCCAEFQTPWPWHELFPNVQILGVLSKQAPKYLEYFFSKFKHVEELGIQTCENTQDMWDLLSGGIPDRVDFSRKTFVYNAFTR